MMTNIKHQFAPFFLLVIRGKIALPRFRITSFNAHQGDARHLLRLPIVPQGYACAQLGHALAGSPRVSCTVVCLVNNVN